SKRRLAPRLRAGLNRLRWPVLGPTSCRPDTRGTPGSVDATARDQKLNELRMLEGDAGGAHFAVLAKAVNGLKTIMVNEALRAGVARRLLRPAVLDVKRRSGSALPTFQVTACRCKNRGLRPRPRKTQPILRSPPHCGHSTRKPTASRR